MSEYPQAPPFRPDEIGSFLERALIAKLGTISEDGSVHIAPLWFRYRDGELLFGTQEITRKIRNIHRNNQVTVLIDTTEPALQAVMIYGTAELDYDDVTAKRIFIFEHYMPPEMARQFALSLASRYEQVVIRVKPERIVSFDYSKGF